MIERGEGGGGGVGVGCGNGFLSENAPTCFLCLGGFAPIRFVSERETLFHSLLDWDGVRV